MHAGKQTITLIWQAGLVLLVSGALADVTGAANERWYTPAQAAAGAPLYAEHCAWCHGERGEGEPGWEERDSMGFYPPPPLDASGHADEHPLADKLATLKTGGGPFGGSMPSFADVLDEQEMLAVLAWVQSLWSDEVYAGWQAIDAGLVEPPAGDGRHH